jgi:hypothetical protein
VGCLPLGGVALASVLAVFLISLLLTYLTHIRIEFDGARRIVTIERRCLWFWSKSDTFSFEAIGALAFTAGRFAPRCLVLSSADGHQSLLGRIWVSKTIIDTQRELHALIFGEDEVIRSLRQGGSPHRSVA